MKINSLIKPVSLILCALQLFACSTIQPSHKLSSKLEDQIIAIGKITHNQSNKIVFSGEKYTYVAEQGGEAVFKIIENTQAEQRSVINRLPIEFNMITKTDFTTSLAIRYEVPISQLKPAEYENLKALGFNRTTYTCSNQIQNDTCKYPLASIQLRGKVHEKDPNTIPVKLKQPYPIYITANESPTNNKDLGKQAGNVVKTIVIVPLAVVGAVLYLPVILGAAILTRGDSDAWH